MWMSENHSRYEAKLLGGWCLKASSRKSIKKKTFNQWCYLLAVWWIVTKKKNQSSFKAVILNPNVEVVLSVTSMLYYISNN